VLEFPRYGVEGGLPEFKEMFATTQGEMLGSQADEVLEFTMKGHIFSAMMPMISWSQEISHAIASGEFREAIEALKEKPCNDDLEQLEAFEKLMKDYSVSDNGIADVMFTKEDRVWFLSLIAFSLHTYLEVYTKSIIERMCIHSPICEKLEPYLQEIANKRSDKKRNPILSVAEMTQFGVASRFKTIEEGLGISDVLLMEVGEPKMNVYRRAFDRFLRIRNKVAHRNPRLKEHEYTFEDLEKDLDYDEPDFSELDNLLDVPSFFRRGFEKIQDAFIDISELVKKTAILVTMAIYYPALIDAVLNSSFGFQEGWKNTNIHET
jgi:hypothetical protein